MSIQTLPAPKKRVKDFSKKVLKHWELFATQILTIGVLLALLLTPVISNALVDKDNLEPNSLMGLVNPEQSDANALTRQKTIDEFVLRYMREEMGVEMSQEELENVRDNGDYTWFSTGSDTIAELTARRDLFLQNYRSVASFVNTMEQVNTEVVMSSTPSNASLADAPVDTMILLEQREKLYDKILQVLKLEYKILQIQQIFVTIKMAFMPKLTTSPLPPHLTLCSSYQGMTFPSLLDQVEIPLPDLMEELAGVYEGYVEDFESMAESFETTVEDTKTQIAEGKELVKGGWKEELAEYTSDRDTNIEEEQALCDGDFSSVMQGSSSLTALSSRQQDACEVTKTFEEGTKLEATEKEKDKCESCQQGGEVAGKIERFTETTTETVQATLQKLMAKLNSLKPSM
ncbi:MAG: hypothetical protein PHU71_00035 [Candidatus Gracilibacteria bacterium]|nr:hypothetical protein [Candidatus Gracilibacteria bacterium]